MAGSFKRSILVINPNSTTAMTDALKPLVDTLGFDTVSHLSILVNQIFKCSCVQCRRDSNTSQHHPE